jgi:glucose-1-phosphate thymidylyltransferase
MLGGLRDILIISTPHDLPMMRDLLGDGSRLGLNLQYVEQQVPNGLAQAFVLGADFIGDSGVSLILGDNLFYGKLDFYRQALAQTSGASIFGYQVKDPERYGVVEFDKSGRVLSIEEKPTQPKSPYAVPGLYVYDNQVVEIARNLRPSARGEYEITDVNKVYLEQGNLYCRILGRGVAWLDTGTPGSLLEASQYIAAIENRQGLKIACLEEIAFLMKFIDAEQLEKLIAPIAKSNYGEYLRMVLEEHASQSS